MQLWVPFTMTAAAGFTTLTAALASRRADPRHPLVEKKSDMAFAAYVGAAFTYAAAALLLVLGLTWPAAALAFGGLFASALGYAFAMRGGE